MKVFSVVRSTLLVAAVLGACVADAKKLRLCDADGHPPPAPTPAASGKPASAPVPAPAPASAPAAKVPAPAPAPAAAKKESGDVAGDADSSAPGPAAPGSAPSGSGQAPAAPGPAPAPASTPAPASSTSAPAPSSAAPAPAPAGGAVTNAGNVKSKYSYTGSNAGGPGTYQMVTDCATCAKTPHSVYSPISPLDDDLTFVFRGPMTINHIAIFDGRSGSWNKVSSFDKGGASNNIVFFNNRNIDYSGKTSPQGFATSDGRGVAQSPTSFSGELGSATSPNGYSIYADEKTGAEVNIFQDKKCGDVECIGYYDKDGTAYKGWDGAKKIFVTEVLMPHGGKPDMPAVWALNGQIVRTSQYGCNCRGVGTKGGCGELDIVEVLEKDLNVVATHYYKFDSSTGHDSWCKRPSDAPGIYITLIDESYGVKVIEVDSFDFSAGSISNDVVAKWLSA